MNEQHIPHSELVAAADGELSEQRAAEVREHLEACWTCRTEMKEIEESITEFVRAHQGSMVLPSADGPRAMLKARMAEFTVEPPQGWRDRLADFLLAKNRFAYLGGGMAAIAAVMFVVGIIQVSDQQFRALSGAAVRVWVEGSGDRVRYRRTLRHAAGGAGVLFPGLVADPAAGCGHEGFRR